MRPVKYDDVTVSSIGEVLGQLEKQYEPQTDTVWFRGHSNGTWSLTPSLYRDDFKLEHESTLMTRFKQNALPLLDYRPNSSWEWMFLMRHHGCPTRLLDWTESPLVALYFACQEDSAHDQKDGHLWCLLPTALNEHWGMTGTHLGDIPAFGSDILNDYSHQSVVHARGIRKSPAAAIAPREAGRMTVQQSVFTIHHVDTEPVETSGDTNHVWRLVIPSASKSSLRKQLATLGINRLSIFSDLDSVGHFAKQAIQ